MLLHKIGFDYTDILKTRKAKRDLPLMGKLPIRYDLSRLRQEVLEQLNQNQSSIDSSPFAADPASSEHNYHLKNTRNESFIKNYDEFYRQYSLVGYQELTDEARALAEKCQTPAGDISPVQRLKGMVKTGLPSYHPHYDERNYTKPTKYMTGYVKEILNSFRAQSCRSAIVVLNPGQSISPHFDIGPEFITRLHLPIFSNPGATFGVRGPDGDWYEYRFVDDGSLYFLNAGFEHYARNDGSEPRMQIRICLNGQEDLDGLEALTPVKKMSDQEVRTKW